MALALTKRVVEVHGGRIDVVSPVANEQTRCSFLVAAFSKGEVKMNRDVTPTILLVEDDDVAAESVVRSLQKHGCNYPVVWAKTDRSRWTFCATRMQTALCPGLGDLVGPSTCHA